MSPYPVPSANHEARFFVLGLGEIHFGGVEKCMAFKEEETLTGSAEILKRLDLLFGEQWWDERRIVAKKPGWVEVYLFQQENGAYSISQHWDWKGILVPAPEFVVRCPKPPNLIQVISWEDWLDDDSPGLNHRDLLPND